jgi:uncharacterized SAM-binding protein YcdF (DUF218 family)
VIKRMTVRRLGLFAFLSVFAALVLLAFANAGRWLVVADPLQSARAVVVLGGHVPFRAMEAAAVYKQGWAAEVWLTQGGLTEAEASLDRLAIDRTPEHVVSGRVLERLGVPADVIRVLPGRNINTADEVRTVASQLQALGGNRVIIVTSKSHARRVKVIWRILVGRPEVVVRYATGDPFDPARWWLNTADAMAVSREWFGLLNAWARFPVKSEHW